MLIACILFARLFIILSRAEIEKITPFVHAVLSYYEIQQPVSYRVHL